jgi:hypothetical protein
MDQVAQWRLCPGAEQHVLCCGGFEGVDQPGEGSTGNFESVYPDGSPPAESAP